MSCHRLKKTDLMDVDFTFESSFDFLEQIQVRNSDWSWFSSVSGKGTGEVFNRRLHLKDYQMFLLCKVIANDLRPMKNGGEEERFRLVPTPQIDHIWRSHLRNPVDYNKFCTRVVRMRSDHTDELSEFDLTKDEEKFSDSTENAERSKTKSHKVEENEGKEEGEINEEEEVEEEIGKKRKRDDDSLSSGSELEDERSYHYSYFDQIIDYDRSYSSLTEEERNEGVARLKQFIARIAPKYQLHDATFDGFQIFLEYQKKQYKARVANYFTFGDLKDLLNVQHQIEGKIAFPWKDEDTIASLNLQEGSVVRFRIERQGVC